MKGKVYLVGAGPGDPELLTLKALRLLRTADAVLYDDLIPPEILALISPAAQQNNVGKRAGTKKISQEEINFLMIALAESGLQVLRLKSGDPLIFGRAGEEIEALRQAAIPYELIPGVTSAFGAAASAEIPLTHRHASSALVFITAHQAAESDPADWSKLAGSGATLVIYMPGQNYGELAAKLMNSGLTGQTPCAIVSRATTNQQQAHRTTISDLPAAPHLPSPSLLVVGEVVRFARTVLAQPLALVHHRCGTRHFRLFKKRGPQRVNATAAKEGLITPQMKDQIASLQLPAEQWTPQRTLAWAFDRFGDSVAISSAFGAEGMVLIDMAARIRKDFRLFTIDTEFLFPETYALMDRIEERYGIEIQKAYSVHSPEEQERAFGPGLWERDPDLCCNLRKVEPLRRKLKGLSAWITSIRRDQTSTRSTAGRIEWDGKFGLVKINPIINWTASQVWGYIHDHEVPYNPLHDQDYPSIGCTHCTRAVRPGEDARSGRWPGFSKTECGLHMIEPARS